MKKKKKKELNLIEIEPRLACPELRLHLFDFALYLSWTLGWTFLTDHRPPLRNSLQLQRLCFNKATNVIVWMTDSAIFPGKNKRKEGREKWIKLGFRHFYFSFAFPQNYPETKQQEMKLKLQLKLNWLLLTDLQRGNERNWNWNFGKRKELIWKRKVWVVSYARLISPRLNVLTWPDQNSPTTNIKINNESICTRVYQKFYC